MPQEVKVEEGTNEEESEVHEEEGSRRYRSRRWSCRWSTARFPWFRNRACAGSPRGRGGTASRSR